jgi:hypothetical protein
VHTKDKSLKYALIKMRKHEQQEHGGKERESIITTPEVKETLH